MKSAIAVSALVVAVGWGTAVVFAQDREAIVKDRLATMKAMSAAISGIKKYLDGQTDQVPAKNAEDIVKAALSLPEKFPHGTGMEAFPDKSAAKPVIWTDWDKFLAVQKNLVAQAQRLEAAVKTGDKKAVAEEYAATIDKGCGACHETYRENLG